MNARSKQWIVIGTGSLLVLLAICGAIWHGYREQRTLAASKQKQPILRVGQHVVDDMEFREAQNRFFKRWCRNSEMLRLTDEERTDRMVEELINQIAIEEYLKQHIKVDAAAVADYLNRYIKIKYATEAELLAYLDSIGCKKRTIKCNGYSLSR